MSVDDLTALRIELRELRKKRFRGFTLKFFSERRLGRHGGNNVVVDNRVDVQSCAAAQDRNGVAFYDIANGALCEALVSRNGKGALGRCDAK